MIKKKFSESVWPLVIVLPIFVHIFKGELYVAYSIHELMGLISVDWNFVTHGTKKNENMTSKWIGIHIHSCWYKKV